MRVFRKVVLPVAWVAIFAAIAVSLAVMAFGDEPAEPGSGRQPTGQQIASNTGVSRGTIENTIRLKGSIAVDPVVEVKTDDAGVVNHLFVPVGARVEVGDPILQIRSEGSAEPAPVDAAGSTQRDKGSKDDDEPESEPRPTYHNVVATKAGKITTFAKEVGDDVAEDEVVTSIRQLTFRAVGEISAIDQYRLLDPPSSATVTIPGGPPPFECGGLSVGDPADEPPAPVADAQREPEFGPNGEPVEQGAGTTVTCRVPDDVRVFDQLEMSMSIDAGRAEDVLVVPVTAVRGLVKRGTVWVVTADGPVEREVRLGETDGTLVEVRKGVQEGEEILEFVPGASPSGPDGGEFGPGVGG